MEVVGAEICKQKKRHHSQTGGESVYAVNQIHGIGDIHHKKNRQRQTNPFRNFGNTEKSAQRIQTDSGHPEHQGSEYLNQELAFVTQTDQIVKQSHDIDQYQTGTEKAHVGQGFGIGAEIGQRLQFDDAAADQEQAEEKHRHKTGAAQTGRGRAVLFAGLGLVKQFFLVRYKQNLR